MADQRATRSKNDRAALENRKMTLLTRLGPRQELIDDALERCPTAVIPGSCRAWSECERTQELFLLNRRLTAREALAFGLVSRLTPSGAVESEAARWSMAAPSTAAIAPLVIVGIFLERYIVSGLITGAGK
jgi:enoyl-CoA hydratase/carnithine racemase